MKAAIHLDSNLYQYPIPAAQYTHSSS